MEVLEAYGRFPAWTVPEILRRTLRSYPEKTFIEDPSGQQETYAQFHRHSEFFAAHLAALGMSRGDRIAILAPSGLPALHGWMAAQIGGFVDVALNTAQKGQQLQHMLSLSDPTVLLVAAEHLETVAPLDLAGTKLRHVIVIGEIAPRTPSKMLPSIQWHTYEAMLESAEVSARMEPQLSDTASIIFTSGTSGPAKAVLMPHAQVSLLAWITLEQCEMTPDDRFYTVHPLFHIAGKFMGVLATIAAGGTVCMDLRFDETLWLERVRKFRATLSIAHGPMIEMIHAQDDEGRDREHAMHRMMCCPLPKSVGTQFTKRFGIRPIEMWGMTEIGCPCWTSLQSQFVPDSCGRLLEDWYDMQVIDPDTDMPLPPGVPGEFAVRPRYPWTGMQGYVKRWEAHASAWRNQVFHTGDFGFVDEQGNYYFLDRMGDRIRRRAENISSFDIETAANSHPAVAGSAAVGVPSGFEGDDDIMLVFVPKGRPPSPVELLTFLLKRLPHFMVPRYVRQIEALPRTPTNKVRKQILREEGIKAPDVWDRKVAGIALRDLTGEAEA